MPASHADRPRSQTPTPAAVLPSPLVVSEPAAAKMIGLSTRGLQRLVAGGKLRRVKIGRRTVYRIRDIENYINSL